MNRQPKASVIILAYNHEKYISQAIEGTLMQKTDFNYEILIGEDDSSDATREICKKYAAKYPENIRLFLNDRKNVIYINGRPTGRWNFINLLKNARGEYIAYCDGDDYWHNVDKLQNQVEFLEANPAYGAVYSDFDMIFENGRKRISHCLSTKRFSIPTGYIYNDLLIFDNFFCRPSAGCFRNESIMKYIDFELLKKYLPCDLIMLLELSRHVQIGFINKSFITYRKREESVSNSQDVIKQYEYSLTIFETINYFINKYDCPDNIRRENAVRYHRNLFRYSLRLNDVGLTRKSIYYLALQNINLLVWEYLLYKKQKSRLFQLIAKPFSKIKKQIIRIFFFSVRHKK